MKSSKYYLGLDIGTNSVGYAVTDEQYNLKKFHGEPAWGVTVFDEANLNADRRSFRTARRRLDRRQQRVTFIQELFAEEINRIDPKFIKRLHESYLYRDETDTPFTLFNDDNYTDQDYYKQYPTIHHLIKDLMENTEPRDVRLVYLACAWLVAHRGHFLSNINRDNLGGLCDFNIVFEKLNSFLISNDCEIPWSHIDPNAVGEILKKRNGVTAKRKELINVLLDGKKPAKAATEVFKYSMEAVIKLLAGGTCKVKDLFSKEEYEEAGSLSLGMDEDKFGELMANTGDDYELIAVLRSVYDWAVLVDVLGEESYISESKVKVYEQHKTDLAFLKKIIKKYCPESYDDIFRVATKKGENKDNYTAYVYHTNDGDTSELNKTDKDSFSKYISKVVKNISPEEDEKAAFEDMLNRLELRTFLPKQKDTDNRVIPHQLYWHELNRILKNASGYLPFLAKKDEDGLTVSDKIEAVFLFKIPYFVGPLNEHSPNAWLTRKAGKIYPWNFEKMVDLDASEETFIARLTNTCTYLPGERVLPKDSLCYHKFMVLNEINNLKINGEKISIDLKQNIYHNLFMNKKRVTKKRLIDYLVCNGIIEKGQGEQVTGIDIEIKSNLAPQIAFRNLISKGILSEEDVERIIERSSYAEDKSRLARWIRREFSHITDEDLRYITNLKIKDFGRLSRRFLCEFEGADKESGEVTTILAAMWNTNHNLMELLSDEYTFKEDIEDFRRNYYADHPSSLEERMDEMYLSNAVRRPVYRTLDIVKDVQKAFGAPSKIFVEMTRGGGQKGKRTSSRKQQILDLYALCKDEDTKHLQKELEAMGEHCDSRLQGDKLFLYYMQLGKCMYSGKPIDLNKLGTKEYDIDHIFPQSIVKDDSILNNKVLCLSEENGKKSDRYPIESAIRHKMTPYWKNLLHNKLITEEKYKRLTRATCFTADEKWGFINRQLTETSQTTKAVATLLKDKYPEAEIVYCKAGLVADFRHDFDLLKSRTYNDLHHAVDAYLNIVTGNVYNMRFSKQWFRVDNNYSVKIKTIFTHPVVCGGQSIWDGTDMLDKVKKIARKNTAHFTKYAFFKKGGLFDQMPVSAAAGLTPLKKGRPTERYGGYNKSSAMFYIPTRYKAGKKTDILIMSVELMVGRKFLEDPDYAKEYAFVRLEHILGKKVDEVSFPMGTRPWKVNTMLSLDGFRVCITGIGSGGRCLLAQPVMQFSSDYRWNTYCKKLEKFVEKVRLNEQYSYSEDHDYVNERDNIELYDLYIDKLSSTIYKKRINNPIKTLQEGREKFCALDIKKQCAVLVNIHQVFGRVASGSDLLLIGGKAHSAATVSFSSTISNWKKNYKEACIIDSSPSGLWNKRSSNLLDLL